MDGSRDIHASKSSWAAMVMLLYAREASVSGPLYGNNPFHQQAADVREF